MKIAVINNFDSFVYNLVRYLKEEGCQVLVQRNDQVDMEALQSCDGILLSPGPGIPSEAGALNDVIKHFVRKKPMLGVCLGHQALAEYFGGTLALAPVPMHGKSSTIRNTGKSKLFKNLPEAIEIGRYHSWIVKNPAPDELTITATYEDEIMAFEHTQLPIFGVQFHPESILTPHGRKMIENFMNSVRRAYRGEHTTLEMT
ncbi:MAG: aminodeoxychorismate/anthranilate synthase component II [Crocinitomicaceae bacterium]